MKHEKNVTKASCLSMYKEVRPEAPDTKVQKNAIFTCFNDPKKKKMNPYILMNSLINYFLNSKSVAF